MVAAGIAVGFTVVLAVLIQLVASLLPTLERLVPLLVVAALLVVAVPLFRRRSRARGVQSDQGFPLPLLPPAGAPMSAAVPMSAPAPTRATVDQQASYLHWGAVQDLARLPAVYGSAAQPRRSPGRPRPSHPTGNSRP